MKFLAMCLLAVIVSACGMAMNNEVTEADKKLLIEAKEVFAPIGKTVIDTQKEAAKIALGEKLYFENKLSINDKISCNSCHKLDQFGVDNEATSPGHDGTRGGRNSPTVYNAALNFVQFWDGRAKDLAAQAKGPILNPIEHGLPNEKAAMAKINSPEYLGMFKAAFPGKKDSFTYNNLGIAIASFEKTLLTPSRFDDFLNGDIQALNRKERDGLNKFVEIGCTSCHSGAGVGGSMFQKLGAINEFKNPDMGRFEVTKNEDDKQHFKVPTLRNIVHTGPYFHDGSVKTLDEAIKLMAYHQLDYKVTQEEIDAIKAFLGSLSGKKDTFYVKK